MYFYTLSARLGEYEKHIVPAGDFTGMSTVFLIFTLWKYDEDYTRLKRMCRRENVMYYMQCISCHKAGVSDVYRGE